MANATHFGAQQGFSMLVENLRQRFRIGRKAELSHNDVKVDGDLGNAEGSCVQALVHVAAP